jgi:hypothetical protein
LMPNYQILSSQLKNILYYFFLPFLLNGRNKK